MDSFVKQLSFDVDTSFVDKLKESMIKVKEWMSDNLNFDGLKDSVNEFKRTTIDALSSEVDKTDFDAKISQYVDESEKYLSDIKTLKAEISEIEMFEDLDDPAIKLKLQELKNALSSTEKDKKIRDKYADTHFSDDEKKAIRVEEKKRKDALTDKSVKGLIKAVKHNWSDEEALMDRQQEGWDNMVDFFSPGGGMEDKLEDSLKSLVSAVGDFFKDTIKEAFEIMSEMASYDLANTTKYNADAWGTAMNYGMTGADAYAFNQAKERIGVSSDEELYQAMMSPELQKRFKQYFDQYQQEYEDNIELSRSVQKFQTEFEDFKREITYEFIDFFTNNKDLIMTAIKVGMDFMEDILSLVGWLVDFFGAYEAKERTASQRSSDVSDIINNYSSSSTNNNTNVRIDNTFNNVGKGDQTWLSNAGQMTYDQIIKALQ